MSDYKAIFGKKIKFLTSDLDNAEGEGEVFYNNTDDEFKVATRTFAWSSSAPLVEGRSDLRMGGTGTKTAGLVAFGNPSSGDDGYVWIGTEEYDGTGWSTGGNTTHAASLASLTGPQTAGLACGISDSPTTLTITYNGSAWADSGNAFPGVGTSGVVSGTQTAALYGGQGNDESHEYNGSAWTAGGNMNTDRDGDAIGWGSQTAGLITTGVDGTNLVSASETYDGSSWTSGTNINTARRRGTGSQLASQDDGLAFGGSPTRSPNAGTTTDTEHWDGTSWTEIANLGTARNNSGGFGSSSSSAVTAGNNPNSGITEEYDVTAMTVTQGVWAAGGDTADTHSSAFGAGTQTAALKAGGNPPGSGQTDCEEYNGTAWAEGGALGTARYSGVGCGTQTAGLAISGFTAPPAAQKGEVEEYNGSSWTESGNVTTARRQGGGFGIQTAAVFTGGNVTGINAEVEEYDGSSWTEVTNLPTTTRQHTGAGTLTAGLIMGGCDQPGTTTRAESYEYDGTSWTDGGDLMTKRQTLKGYGIQTAAVVTGGEEPSPGVAICEAYNGTVWSTFPNMANGRYNHNAATAGTQALGLVSYAPGDTNGTEEFTGGSTALNLKTITDS